MLDACLDSSLVLVCYNEEAILENNVRQTFQILDQTTFSYEILFVDDCSRDRTRELIDRVIRENPERRLTRIFHEKNKGRGSTVADGMRAASGEIGGYIDLDLEVHAR
jgi:glycosyltransferase involved in cell wall biosynthesis